MIGDKTDCEKVYVIKLGGAILECGESLKSFAEQIHKLHASKIAVIIIHGGGNDINQMLKRQGIEPRFDKGLRITDSQTIEVVEMVLSGKNNKRIVSELQLRKLNAVGISGKDHNLILCKKQASDGLDLGFVGEITDIDQTIIRLLISNNIIPVISPIGTDKIGLTYNINADAAASAIASSLEAQRLIYMTDVDGVYMNFKDKNSVIPKITPEYGNSLINDGIVSEGMIPKVKNCIEALYSGIDSVHIINGKTRNVLEKIEMNVQVGTTFYR
ncbi:MAG: Acetylglutamate kinase [Clostridiales bacterium 38_11]|nr:MAG: Acetylglutamate kinase [Clostridiales bacterium 38_11]HBH12252.1 acetylglutamate kinase [Clostridiales bacterium]